MCVRAIKRLIEFPLAEVEEEDGKKLKKIIKMRNYKNYT